MEKLRLIVKDNNEERKIEYREQNNAIPRLYIEMDKPIMFDEVMIGPKVSNVAELATYLNICTNVSRVSKSSIAYR